MRKNTKEQCKHVPENKHIIGMHLLGFKKVYFVNHYTQKCEKCGQPINIKRFKLFRAAIAVFYVLLVMFALVIHKRFAAFEGNAHYVKAYYTIVWMLMVVGWVVWRFGYCIAVWDTAKLCYYESNDKPSKLDGANMVVRRWTNAAKRIALILAVVVYVAVAVTGVIKIAVDHTADIEDFAKLTLKNVNSTEDMIALYPDKPYIVYESGTVFVFINDGERYLYVTVDEDGATYIHSDFLFYEYTGDIKHELSEFDGASNFDDIVAITPDQPYIVYSNSIVFVYENAKSDYVNIVCNKETGEITARSVTDDIVYSPIRE